MSETFVQKTILKAVDNQSNVIKSAAKNAKKAFKSMSDSANSVRSSMKGLSSGVKTAAIAFGGFLVLGKINSLFKESISLAGEQASAIAKVEQTIKATGGAAGLTSKELQKMASEFQSVTTFGDEVTLRGQSMLLTFKKIGKDVFPAATEAMLNLSVSMGTDVKESAIQLGKALNDPITGLTALRRVGITFEKEQENMIKNFQKTGDIASAQKMILAELDSQFGGLARAVASTGTGPLIQFQNIIGDVKESLGDALIPVMIEAATEIKNMLSVAKDSGVLKSIFSGIAIGVRLLFGIVSDTLRGLTALFKITAGILNSVSGLFFKFLSKITSGVGSLISFLPKRLIPDGWSEGIKKVTSDLNDLGDAGFDSGGKLFEEGIGSVSKGSRIIQTFKDMTSSASEAKKEIRDIPMPNSSGDIPSGDPTSSKSGKKKASAKGTSADFSEVRAKSLKDRELLLLEIQELTVSSQMDSQDKELELLEIKFQREMIMEERTLDWKKARNAKHLSDISLIESREEKKRLDLVKKSKALEIQQNKQAVSNALQTAKLIFGENKKFAILNKGIAIGEAIVNTSVAFTKALPNVPLAASIAALGAATVGKIAATDFADGGISNIVGGNRLSGDNINARLDSREMVVNTTDQSELFQFIKGLKNGRGQSSVTNNIYYQPNNSFNGSGSVVSQLENDPDSFVDFFENTMERRGYLQNG